MGKWIERLFTKHQFVRRAMVIWAMSLITWVTIRVFTDLAQITAAVNTAFGLVTAILTTVIGHYQWERFKGEKNADVDNG